MFLGCLFLVAPLTTVLGEGNANIVIDESAQASISDELTNRVEASWPWYVTRASGIVAAIALILLMLSGIGFITGTTFAFLEPLTGWATHRALGIILTCSIVLHVGALYFDHFVPFSLSDLFIPFASSFHPVTLGGVSLGSLYVALGVIALYLTVAIVTVSLVWTERKTIAWKLTHLLSYLVMASIFVHTLTLGTDFQNGVLRYVWIGIGFFLLIATITRAWRAYTL